MSHADVLAPVAMNNYKKTDFLKLILANFMGMIILNH